MSGGRSVPLNRVLAAFSLYCTNSRIQAHTRNTLLLFTTEGQIWVHRYIQQHALYHQVVVPVQKRRYITLLLSFLIQQVG